MEAEFNLKLPNCESGQNAQVSKGAYRYDVGGRMRLRYSCVEIRDRKDLLKENCARTERVHDQGAEKTFDYSLLRR